MPSFILDICIRNDQLSVSLFESGDPAHSYEFLAYDIPGTHTLAGALRTVLEQNGPQGSKALSAARDLEKCGLLLCDKLLPPGVKTRLRTFADCDLTLRIDEELVYIPWELLFDGEMFLCLRFALALCVRTKATISPQAIKASGSPWRMLIIADTTGDLPAAALEASGIRRELKSVTNVKITSKTGNVLAHFLRRHVRDFDIVHFAGHVVYDVKEPHNSGWVFADARITAHDFMILGAAGSLPAIVFMNACYSDGHQAETEKDQQETQRASLAQALFLSGVRCVIATRSRLADQPAQDMASYFYRGLSQGLSANAALRQARVSLRLSEGLNDLSWAGYILYGPMAGICEAAGKKSGVTAQHTAGRYHVVKRYIVRHFWLKLLCFSVVIWAASLLTSTVMLQYRLHVARSAAAAGKLATSIQAYSDIIRMSPECWEAVYDLGRVYAHAGQHQKAVDMLARGFTQAKEIGNSYRFERFGVALLSAQFAAGSYTQVYALAGELTAGPVKERLNIVFIARLAGSAAAMLQQFSLADAWYEKAILVCDEFLCADHVRLTLLRADNRREALLTAQVNKELRLPDTFTVSATFVLYEQAATQALAASDITGQARALAGMAALEKVRENFVKALGYYREALQLWQSVGSLTQVDRCYFMILSLDVADMLMVSSLDFTGVRKELQRVKALAQAPDKIPREQNRLWLYVQRRYESFLHNVASKGYKNSSLYQEAVAIYSAIF